MDNRTAYIFIGRSGCGKGTQAKKLIESLTANDERLKTGADHILYSETGQLFRDFIETDNYSAGLSRQLMAKAEFQPTFLAVWIWARVLVDKMDDHTHIVFDGTPRSRIEAEVLDTALSFYGFSRKIVIHLDVSRDWSKKRLLARGRKDDNDADIERRLDWYETEVKSAVDFYNDHSDYRRLDIDGTRSIEEVHADLIGQL
ncbi:MAG: nucleoside monophosphate kinase [Candidatus Paceibacterota bacterium]